MSRWRQLALAAWLRIRIRLLRVFKEESVAKVYMASRVFDYLEEAEDEALTAEREGWVNHEEFVAYYDGQMKLMRWIVDGANKDSRPLKPRKPARPRTGIDSRN